MASIGMLIISDAMSWMDLGDICAGTCENERSRVRAFERVYWADAQKCLYLMLYAVQSVGCVNRRQSTVVIPDSGSSRAEFD